MPTHLPAKKAEGDPVLHDYLTRATGGSVGYPGPFSRNLLHSGLMVAVLMTSGCSVDHDVLCLAGYEIREEPERPTFNLKTLTSFEKAERHCSPHFKKSFESCLVDLKKLCNAYQSGAKIVVTDANTGLDVGAERVNRNMKDCKKILDFSTNEVSADVAHTWWGRSCNLAGTNAYDACLVAEGFDYEKTKHLRCKPMNVIR